MNPRGIAGTHKKRKKKKRRRKKKKKNNNKRRKKKKKRKNTSDFRTGSLVTTSQAADIITFVLELVGLVPVCCD